MDTRPQIAVKAWHQMNWWIGNPSAVALAFLAVLALAFVAFSGWKGASSIRWRWYDLSIALLGGFGLLGLVVQASFTAGQIMKPTYTSDVAFERRFISQTFLKPGPECMLHPRVPSSPPNNEEMEAERAAICQWASTELRPLIDRISKGENARVNVDGMRQLPSVSDASMQFPFDRQLNELRKEASAWNNSLDRLEEASSQQNDSALYLSGVFISPYALALALALQVVKIFYEKRN